LGCEFVGLGGVGIVLLAQHMRFLGVAKADDGAPQNAVPAYLLAHDQVGAVGGVDLSELGLT
jgi:hypothetical protein